MDKVVRSCTKPENLEWNIAAQKSKRLRRQRIRTVKKCFLKNSQTKYDTVGDGCLGLALSFLTIPELISAMVISKRIRKLSRLARNQTEVVDYKCRACSLPQPKLFRKISSWCTSLRSFQNFGHSISFHDLRRIVLNCKKLEVFHPGRISCGIVGNAPKSRLRCSDNLFSFVADHLPNLRSFHAYGCTPCRELNALKRFKNLDFLQIGPYCVHDEQADLVKSAIEVLKASVHLECLSLMFDDNASDVILKSNVLSRLKDLHVYDNFLPEATKARFKEAPLRVLRICEIRECGSKV